MQIHTHGHTSLEEELYEITKATQTFENYFHLQAEGRLLGFAQVILTTTHLSIKHSSLFKLKQVLFCFFFFKDGFHL